MKSHQNTVGINDEWLTPPDIVQSLGLFDLDPCSPINRPFDTASKHLTTIDDGLNQKWKGRVWLNPPFNRYVRPKWMKKMAEHNNGIMLVPAAAETKAFSEHVWGKCAGLLFMRKRPYFYYVDGTQAKANSGCTICLVAYGAENLRALRKSDLGHVVVEG